MRAFVLAVLFAVLVPASSFAQGFATTNLQGLAGTGFDDTVLLYDTPDGFMATLTVNHFSTWAWGDNFVFVDLLRGQFEGTNSRIYAEWHPRLSLTRPFGGLEKPLAGVFRDVFLAGEVNHGFGFYAYLAGFSTDFALPENANVGLSLFYRWDNFTRHGWQVSPFWTVPFKLGPVPLLFAGFVDVFSPYRNAQLDVLAQPQLMVDALGLAGGPDNRLLVGVEWFLHYNQAISTGALVSAPQAMVQWNWH